MENCKCFDKNKEKQYTSKMCESCVHHDNHHTLKEYIDRAVNDYQECRQILELINIKLNGLLK
jgi:hypothetical protein